MKPVLSALILLVAGTAQAQESTGLTLREIYDFPAIPRGYARVWDDDRLNPNRARGTAAGEAQMRAIWTDEVPMRLQPAPPRASAAAPATGFRVLTEAPGVFVQVDPAGAPVAGTVSGLRAAGIPAQQGVLRGGAGDVPIVLAGPYGDRSSAEAAVAALQRLGYSGRVLRN
ncbi:SPOR domain-containing protein [Palleronia sp. KMU-117]|uniref:SPOR domain-containing protein n=1 Tax=Palleronia sp. KMU-117 TaxID=3434108 RepID=UPI003D723F08